jgi:hypothetical protein
LTDSQLNRLAELCGYPNKYRSGNNDGQTELDWKISFTRPEISPCLSKWSTDEQRNTPEYKEALSIIKQGTAELAAHPRGEDPNFVPNIPFEQHQQDKYNNLLAEKEKFIDAILKGEKVFDKK